MKEAEWIELSRDWLLTKGLGFAADFAVFLLLLLVGSQIIRAVVHVADEALERAPRVRPMLRTFTLNVLRKTLWVILLMVALPRIGIEIGPLVASLGVAGFIIGFAFQESLSNLAAGVMILLNEPFIAGDYVEAGGHAGTVRDLNMMATTMTTPDNKAITIPNRVIWGKSIVNYSKNPTRRIDMTVSIDYSADVGEACAVVKKLLDADERVLKDPAPAIELNDFGESSVNLIVRPWVQRADYGAVKFAFNRNLKDAFAEKGIEIPFPQIDVRLSKTEA
jgi:small conductance mechanosensitive channel